MKLFFYLFVAMLLLSSCGKNIQEIQDEADRQAIDSTVTVIDSTIYDCRFLGIGAYSINEARHTLSVAYYNGRPIFITNVSTNLPAHTLNLYLSPENGQVILAREINVGEKKREYKEAIYYFSNKRFAGAKISSEDAHTRANSYKKPWEEYKPDGKEFDTTYTNVKTLADQMIATVQAERPNLSPAANAARQRGAIYWAVGYAPNFTLSVTPNAQLTFETNNNTERYIFDSVTESPIKAEVGTNGGMLYRGEQKDKVIEVRFISTPCTDKWGTTYPSTVFITFGNLQYQGCGSVL